MIIKRLTKIIALAMSLVLILSMSACANSGKIDTYTGIKSNVDIELLKSDIKEMVKGVYEPKTAEEFNITSEEWAKRMSADAHSKLFWQAPIKELTVNDLKRVVNIHFVTFGPAELQSDKQPKMLVSFSVVNTETEKVIRIDIEMGLNEEGLIQDIIVTV